eukprot:c9310_g1_i1.p1 GENE.c9310_g1_i1~~c9310_g1_i1.p1  ORF type:complete len:461 (+),score=86.86 c9310_g1_i1:48-1430(+)
MASSEMQQPLLQDSGDEAGLPTSYFRKRYIMSIACFTGLFLAYLLRVCISVASQKPAAGSNEVTMYTELGWNSENQGIVLGAFYAGYILTQVPGALLSIRYGTRAVFGIGMLGASVMTALTPLAAEHSIELLCAVRILTGVFEGVSFPSQAHLLRIWSPTPERSRLLTLALAGCHAGTISCMPLTAFILTRIGWRSVFYIFGSFGCFWTACWFYVVSDSPRHHTTIHPIERDYILSFSDTHITQTAKSTIPWATFFTSPVVWGFFIAGTCNPFGFYELLSELPTYLSTVYGLSSQKAGLTAVLPYCLLAASTMSSGLIADILMTRYGFKRLSVRTTMMFVGAVPSAICLFALGFFHNLDLALGLLTFAVGTYGFSSAGVNSLIVDVGGAHSSTLYALYNMLGQIGGIVTPILTGKLCDEYGDKEGFNIAFKLCSGLYCTTLVTWLLLVNDVPLVYEKRLP